MPHLIKTVLLLSRPLSELSFREGAGLPKVSPPHPRTLTNNKPGQPCWHFQPCRRFLLAPFSCFPFLAFLIPDDYFKALRGAPDAHTEQGAPQQDQYKTNGCHIFRAEVTEGYALWQVAPNGQRLKQRVPAVYDCAKQKPSFQKTPSSILLYVYNRLLASGS